MLKEEDAPPPAGSGAQEEQGKAKVYKPNPAAKRVYAKLYALYRQLHDAFGTAAYNESLYNVMKDLLALRDEVRGIGKP